MKKGTIYISGKITGLDYEESKTKFATAAENLKGQGWETVNPMELVTDPETPWPEAMEICMNALPKCDALYALPCTVDSKGAQIELDWALRHNLDIYYELPNVEADEPIHDLHSTK